MSTRPSSSLGIEKNEAEQRDDPQSVQCVEKVDHFSPQASRGWANDAPKNI